MVAKITFPKRVEAALHYNENKVQKEKAVCLAAHGYLREASELTFFKKLEGLEHNNILNDKATTKTLHVSLNFDPSENLSNERLVQIASYYMEGIGFGEQPYLVYRHGDAGHPHIHIVSTTIRDDGSRIATHNIGRNASEKTRKAIEQSFGLKRAEERRKVGSPALHPVAAAKAIYGKTETKRAIANVVTAIFQNYTFASLPEYNAALRQFNMVADRGKEGGRTYRNEGLVYRLLDEQGYKVGVPIKASSLSCSPTYKALQKKFGVAAPQKESLKIHLEASLDATIPKAGSLKELSEHLAKQQVYLLPRQNSEGKVYGITFVDNRTKCVFNGSDLGKEYSAAGLLVRLSQTDQERLQLPETKHKASSAPSPATTKDQQAPLRKVSLAEKLDKPLDLLLSAKEQVDGVPRDLLGKKRKKKKGRNPYSSH